MLEDRWRYESNTTHLHRRAVGTKFNDVNDLYRIKYLAVITTTLPLPEIGKASKSVMLERDSSASLRLHYHRPRVSGLVLISQRPKQRMNAAIINQTILRNCKR
jgi:hypothetical protein